MGLGRMLAVAGRWTASWARVESRPWESEVVRPDCELCCGDPLALLVDTALALAVLPPFRQRHPEKSRPSRITSPLLPEPSMTRVGQPTEKHSFTLVSEVVVAASKRSPRWFLIVPLLIAAVLGLLALGGLWAYPHFFGPAQSAPTPLASVPVPHAPNSLAWSADGVYLAAGAWGSKKADPSEVYVVDVAAGTVAATLRATGAVCGLSFSPDGKWLAVITRQNPNWGATPAVLVVFDVPAFAEKFKAKSSLGDGFLDLAWAGGGEALVAIDAPDAGGPGKRQVRRWAVPAFAEQPAITAPQAYRYEAIAVSPDGGTLALADVGQGADGKTHLVRLFDLAMGAERASSRAAPAGNSPPRLGFTPDGKAVGVFNTAEVSWWDVVTGQPAKPDPARFAAPPA